KNIINILAITKLINPQPGNVKIQVSIISFTTPKLMAESRLTAPTPMIALVLVWVVDTGIPVTLASSRQKAPARSAENPWNFSSFTISIPTDLMIFSPPTLVPTPMTTEQSTISHTGITMPSTLFCPLQKATPRNKTPMNFCPSWAPCMKLINAAPKIWPFWKKELVLLRSILPQIRAIPLQITQPTTNPKTRLNTSPYRTFTHSLKLMPPIPPCTAIAAPERPAIRLWLSLVGMPNTDAATLYTTMENSAAHKATRA